MTTALKQCCCDKNRETVLDGAARRRLYSKR
jgi:hypothetical protein